jgi:multiphosphoryl transfer protein
VVGIVVVSHSRALACAVVALAKEMVHGRAVRIHVAAGLDEQTFGTDAVQILEAITRADGGEGVVVLMDLGSAVLSAELAIDLLDEDARERVLLCPAPLVEGLIVAAVAATSGASKEEIAMEAAGSLAGKQSHLGVTTATQQANVPASATPSPADGEPLVGTFTVANSHGLHARPAALLVQAVRGHDARVQLRNLTSGAGPVPASSLSKVATLGALRGQQVQVSSTGRQAREALDHVLSLARRGFDEPIDGGAARALPRTPTTTPAADDRRAPSPLGPVTESLGADTAPVPASPGIGIGPAALLHPTVLEIPATPSRDPRGEWRALREATASVRRKVQQVRAATAREVGEGEAAIFDAHLLLLDDPDILDDVHSGIDAGQSAAAAWTTAVERIRAAFGAIPDPYLQARAGDVDAVGNQVLRALIGAEASPSAAEGVLIAADLTPAEVAELDRDRVVAIVLAFGSPTAHSTILARSRGIAAVVGAGAGVLNVPAGTLMAVDGQTGEVIVDPDDDALITFRARADALARRRSIALAQASSPALTQDGVAVLVAANLGSIQDARSAVSYGADLAGLVRTEFLFLDRSEAPEVEEQEATYRAIAEALQGRRCTLRTLDVGGDKPLGYLPMATEANPFLGVRGIRLALARPTILADQLLAMVRVAHDHPVDLMFPMVSTLDELLAARAILGDAVKLAGRGQPAGLRVGIMVEIPATALKIRAFAPHVDFFSIGTNDLTQYALAAERGNQALARLADPLDPGVLRLIDAVCRDAGETMVAVCGELAADESATALLVGLGVRELSVSPPAVPAIKQAVRQLDTTLVAHLAATALHADSATNVRALMAATREAAHSANGSPR